MIAGTLFDPENAAPAAKIMAADGFARVFPEHKFRIVKTLQDAGHIVGMTGDGVNDAPALKQADIGIAVSSATDAARAAADVVLTAPGLSVITTAIEEARRIFERMNGAAPRPVRWNMPRILSIASTLGLYGVVASFVLFWILRNLWGLPGPVVQALIFLKLLVGGHMTIYLTRNRGPFWVRPWPSWKLVAICELTQALGTLAVVYGLFMAPTGWQLALFVWAYALVSFMIGSAVKAAIQRLLPDERTQGT